MHVIWDALSRADRFGTPRFADTLWYQSCALEGRIWQPRSLIVTGERGSAHILALGETLHVLVGWRLRHFTSDDGGRTWLGGERLLGDPGTRRAIAERSDATLVDSTLHIAYIAAHPGSSPMGDSVDVWFLRAGPSEVSTPVLIGAFPGAAALLGPPRITRFRDTLYVAMGYWGMRVQDASPPRRDDAVTVTEHGDVALYHSVDGGHTWSSASHLPPPPNGAPYWLSVDQVEFVTIHSTLYVLFDSRGGVHLARVGRGVLDAPRWLEGVSTAYLDARDSRALAFVDVPGSQRLVWNQAIPRGALESLLVSGVPKQTVLWIGDVQQDATAQPMLQPGKRLVSGRAIRGVKATSVHASAVIAWCYLGRGVRPDAGTRDAAMIRYHYMPSADE